MHIGHYMIGMWDQGGVASYIRRTAQAQELAGHRVTLFNQKHSGSETGEIDSSLDTVVVGSDQELFERADERNIDILNLHRSVQSLPDHRVPTVRVLHNHAAYCPSGSQHLKRRDEPCPYVQGANCLHGYLLDHCGSLRPTSVWKDLQTVATHKRILTEIPAITVSRFLKSKMVRAGYSADQIHVVHSPAPDPSDSFVPPPQTSPPRFLFLGRIVPEKGIDWLLRAASHLDIAFHIDIAGDGYAKPEMEKLSVSLGIADRVTFHGWVSSDHVPNLIRSSRAVVFPSTWHEPAGLVPLEAAAQGRPVIASSTGGIPEYVSDSHGFLVPPNDEIKLAECMQQLSNSWELASDMGYNGYVSSDSKFSTSRFIDRLDSVYARVT